MSETDKEQKLHCPGCVSDLLEPYIACIQCRPAQVFICLHCFAKGIEFGTHQNNHPYTVIKHDFPVFDKMWTAVEERQLLEAMAECGYGNWTDISHQVKTKSPQECERHYNKCYVEEPQSALPTFPEADISYHPSAVVFKLSEDPPRPPEHSALYTEMGGYMAARGDFTVEYDNFAELDLRNVTFDTEEDDVLDTELNYACVDVYQRCLQERQRRKRIVRRYGLINLKKLNSIMYNRRYSRTIREYLDGLRVFTRLIPPVAFDKYLEGLHYEYELRNEVKKLQECRKNGITLLRNIKIFNFLKKRQEEERSKRHLLTDVLHHLQDHTACQTWLQRQAVLENISKGNPLPLPNAPRKSAPPLDIMGLPGCERLTSNEKQLCATVRLVPEAFLEFKNVLVNECRKHGSLKLAQARTMIKIDVNKTRKLYDFLISEGLITKEPLMSL